MEILNNNEYKCPISHKTVEEMTEPVCGNDGYTYEKADIINWVRNNGTSPMTREPMTEEDLVSNRALKNEQVKHDEKVESTIDICIVQDISGSMDGQASFVNDNGDREECGLTYHDLTTHAIKMIINTLGETHRLSIVTFSSRSTLLLPLTVMNSDGKKEALRKIETPYPNGFTNLWDGLVMGMNNVPHGTVYLLTDGVPTQPPPRGWMPQLNKFLKDNPNLSPIVKTFGFGYNLDAKLLQNISHTCNNGSFNFIPDSGMICTVFAHSLGNTLCDKKVEENEDINKFIKFLKLLITAEESNLQFNSVQQIVKEYSEQNEFFEQEVLNAVDNADWYNRWGKFYIRSLYDAHLHSECNNFKDKTIVRYKTPEIEKIVDFAEETFAKLPPPVPKVNNTVHYRGGGMRSSNNLTQVTLPQDFMRSYSQPSAGCFSGNCRISTSNGNKQLRHLKKGDMLKTDNGYNRLICIMKSVCHNNQTDLVEFDSKLELEYDTINNDIPPLICVDCDKFYSLGGRENDYEFDIKPDQEFCECTKLLVTPWHPIEHEGKWKFPRDLRKAKTHDMSFVYSFVVENSDHVYIEGWKCITLGHEIKDDPVASHDFWGTTNVINCLKSKSGWEEGVVEITSSIRNDTGEVCDVI